MFFICRLCVVVQKICYIGQQQIDVTHNIVEAPVKPISIFNEYLQRKQTKFQNEWFVNKQKFVKMAGSFGHQCKTVFNSTLKGHVIR